MAALLGVAGPGVLALLRTFGVDGERGVTRGWGVEGALVLPDFEDWGAAEAMALGVVGFPHPSRVLRVILRG